ncbi:hypothetical protein NFK84_20005 [Enterobacter ludwigii]|uniref:hypothetical protein n=1 Tax=Enterobacter ludwigii TaxID=299767 RepID=UPI00243001B7|nr:hypothetical protein [Enterobacter ludwigii]WGA03947.1 hypothetical protein NFK84_20005 [Enterobacter ludwigii]
MKKTISNTYTKSLLHMAVAATVAGVFAAPAFADNTPQEFHAKVNIDTDNTCSLTITPGTSDYNSTLTIDTGEGTAAFTPTNPAALPADLTTVRYSEGCSFTGIVQSFKHTSPGVNLWAPEVYNAASFGVPVGSAMLPMGAYLTATHLYTAANVDISDKFTVTSRNNDRNTLTTTDTPLPTTIPSNSAAPFRNKECGPHVACLGYWAGNRSGVNLAKQDAYTPDGVWNNTFALKDGEPAGTGANYATFGVAFINSATPMKPDGSAPDYAGIPSNTDVKDTWTMEFTIA